MPLELLFTDSTGLYALNEATNKVTRLASIATDVDGVAAQAGSLAIAGNKAYFAGGDPTDPTSVYVSDGTAARTKLVKTFANPNATDVGQFTALSNGSALFTDYDGAGNQTLWTTNGITTTEVTVAGGTTAYDNTSGTVPAINLGPGQSGEIAGKLLFTDTSGLYALNEATNQVTRLAAITIDVNGVGQQEGSLAIAAGTAYFAGGDANDPTVLYASDGTAGGTRVVKTFANPNGTATLADFTPLSNGSALFVYYDGAGNQTLWTTNGTTTTEITVAGGTTAYDNTSGSFPAINLGPGQSGEINGKLLFTDTNGLYSLNEATNQVTRLASISIDVDGVGAQEGSLAIAGGRAYFAGGNPSDPTTLYVSDGTAANTVAVKTFANPNGTATLADFTALSSGSALFVYADGNGNQTLWTTNGTTTTQVSVAGGTTYDNTSNFPAINLGPGQSGENVLSVPPGTADDFNADGKSDLLLQNTNGSIVFYGLNGPAVNATAFVNNPGPTWHVVGEADFNGDGNPDILLQNDNGNLVDYLMTGTTVTAAYSLGNPGSGWHVRGAADFNGDGKADVLLQNDNGTMVLFDTNGAGVIAGISLGQLPAGWAIEGVGDFNGDGIPDVLVESNGGTLVDYTMNGPGTGFVAGGTIANVGPGWTVAGTADYNGDGKADILLHNDNGADVIFTMNGPTVIGTIAVGNPGAAYQGAVSGIDINGDGLPDLVVQSTNSTLVGYTLGNNAAITAAAVLNVPGAGWTLAGGNPTTFLDGTGATTALTGTPGPDQFNLTSYAAGIHTIASFDPAQDAVALGVAAFPSYAAVQANEAPYQGGTLINLSPTAAIVIQGVTPGQLTAANFVLR